MRMMGSPSLRAGGQVHHGFGRSPVQGPEGNRRTVGSRRLLPGPIGKSLQEHTRAVIAALNSMQRRAAVAAEITADEPISSTFLLVDAELGELLPMSLSIGGVDRVSVHYLPSWTQQRAVHSDLVWPPSRSLTLCAMIACASAPNRPSKFGSRRTDIGPCRLRASPSRSLGLPTRRMLAWAFLPALVFLF